MEKHLSGSSHAIFFGLTFLCFFYNFQPHSPGFFFEKLHFNYVNYIFFDSFRVLKISFFVVAVWLGLVLLKIIEIKLICL